MSDLSPRMVKCIATGNAPCKGRGVITQCRPLELYGGKSIEEAAPCPCRMTDMAMEWLQPLTNVLEPSRDWARTNVGKIDRSALELLRPDHNALIQSSKRGGYLLAKEALKAHVVRAGWQAMLPYRLLSEQEMDDYHFQREGDYAKLTGFAWQDYKLYIITLGHLPKSALVKYLAVRLNFLITMGAHIWLIYHHDLPPVADERNFCWSEEMSNAVAGWNRIEPVSGPFARKASGSDSGGWSSRAVADASPRSRPPTASSGDDDILDAFGPNG